MISRAHGHLDLCHVRRYTLSDEMVTAAVRRALGLVRMGAYAQSQTSALSGGQKQRVAIAGALAESSRVGSRI